MEDHPAAVALGAELFVAAWAASASPTIRPTLGPVTLAAHGLLWLATIVTLITGAQYWEQARKELAAGERRSSPPA